MLNETLKEYKTLFSGVNKDTDDGGFRMMLTVHLPPAVCSAIDDRKSEVGDFFKAVGAVYLSGVRHSKLTELREVCLLIT